MCGRFVQKTPLGDIQVMFETQNPVPNTPPHYNAAPTQDLAVVRYNPQTRMRALDLLHWGLVPLWAKDRHRFDARCINARGETVATQPAFRDAFERRRCLVPADAFYEWQKQDGKTVPYAIAPAKGLFALAGLWERWRDPVDVSILRSFTIVTGLPNELCAPIHDRMPVILPPETWTMWLGEEAASPEELQALLRPYPAALMRVYRIGPAVGNVKNDEPSLLEPLLEPATGAPE